MNRKIMTSAIITICFTLSACAADSTDEITQQQSSSDHVFSHNSVDELVKKNENAEIEAMNIVNSAFIFSAPQSLDDEAKFENSFFNETHFVMARQSVQL